LLRALAEMPPPPTHAASLPTLTAGQLARLSDAERLRYECYNTPAARAALAELPRVEHERRWSRFLLALSGGLHALARRPLPASMHTLASVRRSLPSLARLPGDSDADDLLAAEALMLAGEEEEEDYEDEDEFACEDEFEREEEEW
jgi:hypothetical protein